MKTFAAASLPDRETIRDAIDREGVLLVTGVLDAAYIARAKPALEAAIAAEAKYHGTTSYADYGMVLVCSLYGKVFLDLFDNRALTAPFEAVLGEGCIVYAYTSSSMPPRATNYSRRVHRDCPTSRMVPGFPTNIGATILLDDFTLENGATTFLPGSHRRRELPSEEELDRDGEKLVAPAGSVMFFDALVCHAGGVNRTERWRHALTINMCRPWMKQRLDLPRVMSGVDVSSASEAALQKLGFRARVPASYDEYYAPPEKRAYRQAVE